MKIVIVFLAIGFIAIGCKRDEQVDQQIVFAAKAYYDSGEYLYIAGTLTGEGVYYKNNTLAVTCYKERMECLTYTVEQIGPNQVGRLDSPTSYPVTKWDEYEIVATGNADAVGCRKDTISIVRKSETAVWVQEPINQSQAACIKADTRVLKWTIENSPKWKDILSGK